MKKLCFIILIISLHAHSGVEQLLQGLLNSHQACLAEDTDPLTYFETDAIKNGVKKVKCPEDERTMFGNIQRVHCSSRFGSDGFTCAESDPTKVKARLNNVVLMNKIIAYTQLRFDEYKANLVKECCGDKAICSTRFNQVKLIIDSTNLNNAHYESDSMAVNSQTNLINFGMGKMASAYNSENIDRVLLAELGHACQFAINAESSEDYRKFTGPQRCDKEAGLIGFREGLGEEMASCLIKEVESQISEMSEEQKSKFCFGKWYREVFSDMKFRKHYDSIYHWTYDMGRRSQATNYASVYKYIKCGFSEEMKKQICE